MDIDPPAADVLEGGQSFTGLDATALDFWRFAMSDLRTNNVRGYLAEFLVARAVGATGARVEWDPPVLYEELRSTICATANRRAVDPPRPFVGRTE
jgi:hypothetical protein